MKKILFTLTLLFSLHSFGQSSSFSNPVSDAVIFMASNHTSASDAIIVPDDNYAIVIRLLDGGGIGEWVYSSPEYYNINGGYLNYLENGTLLPAGTMIWCTNWSNNAIDYHIILTGHNYINDTSLSSTNVEFPNTIKLFPNPTTSEVALNSDKDYQIEVFDLLGNKVMELTGNTINMEHLSSATYIVNALDLETQESLSYKIIKK